MKYAVQITHDVRERLMEALEKVIAFADAKEQRATALEPRSPTASVGEAAVNDASANDAAVNDARAKMSESSRRLRDGDIALNAANKLAGGPLQLGKSKGPANTPTGPGAEGIQFISLGGGPSTGIGSAFAVANKTYQIQIHIHLPTE